MPIFFLNMEKFLRVYTYLPDIQITEDMIEISSNEESARCTIKDYKEDPSFTIVLNNIHSEIVDYMMYFTLHNTQTNSLTGQESHIEEHCLIKGKYNHLYEKIGVWNYYSRFNYDNSDFLRVASGTYENDQLICSYIYNRQEVLIYSREYDTTICHLPIMLVKNQEGNYVTSSISFNSRIIDNKLSLTSGLFIYE